MKRLMLAVVIAVIAFAVPASARVWHISPDGAGDAPTIKAGVDSATSGDILLLADGVFTGSGNTDVSYNGKAIIISSASGNPFNCVIDCEGSSSNYSRGFLFYSYEGSGSVLEGITVTNGYGYEGGGVWCWRASPTIHNCIFSGNVATHAGGGMYCGGGSQPTVTNVTFFENASTTGGSVYSTDDSDPEFFNTIVSYTLSGAAVSVGDAYSIPAFYCSDIYGNADGDWTGSIENQLGVNGNMCLDPLFCLDENPDEPFTISSCSPCSGINHPTCGLVGAGDIGCETSSVPLEAVVELNPETINVRSRGRYVTCYIELAGGLDPADIDIATVALDGAVYAEATPTEIGDYDSNGIDDLMVKFSRRDVLDLFDEIGEIEVTISGEVSDQYFEGYDTIRIMGKTAKKIASGEGVITTLAINSPNILTSGSDAMIEYSLPESGSAKLTIFDVTGRVVTTLIDEASAAGAFSVSWDGRDAYGDKVASGVYFANLETSKEVVTGKIMVVR
ncbi:MAG: FlgD immunoglobulin-like domain containing protein [bacterium]|jgi:hypothetical protein